MLESLNWLLRKKLSEGNILKAWMDALDRPTIETAG
jgi:hypothetical protein